jgi:hypothetical protein
MGGGVKMIRIIHILTDRGTEYCGAREHHEYQLYLAIEDIDHSRTKARHPQTNGICERFHRTMQDEFYSVAFRKKIYQNIEELQTDADLWIEYYNKERPHSGKYCYGRTPWQTWNESLHLTQEKMLDSHYQKDVNLQMTGETVTGSGEDQPARDNLSDWNGQPGLQSPRFFQIIPRENALKNLAPDR